MSNDEFYSWYYEVWKSVDNFFQLTDALRDYELSKYYEKHER